MLGIEPETISIYCGAIEDVTPLSAEVLEVTMSDVDIGQIINEVGTDTLLDYMKIEDIKEYIVEKEKKESEDEETLHI